MAISIQVELRAGDIIDAVKRMPKADREGFLEDLLAATSEDYLESIAEARADYAAERMMTHEEVFRE